MPIGGEVFFRMFIGGPGAIFRVIGNLSNGVMVFFLMKAVMPFNMWLPIILGVIVFCLGFL